LRDNTELSGEQCLDALLAEQGAAHLRDAGLGMLTELKMHEAILGTR